MSFLRRHRVAFASGGLLVIGAAALVLLALSTDGYPTRKVDLNDGGIWVTSSQEQLFGRLNKPAGSLDAAMYSPTKAQGAAQLDTRQDGAAVVAWDRQAGTLYPVDVKGAVVAKDHGIPVGVGNDVGLAGGTLAVLERSTGRVWAQRVDSSSGVSDLRALDPSAEPVATIEVNATASAGRATAAMAVGSDGTIHVAATSGQIVTVAQSAAEFAAPTVTQVSIDPSSVEVTAVGGNVVILDVSDGSLVLPTGRSVHVDGDLTGAQLQAPAPAGDVVVLATRTSLLSIEIGSGKVTELFAGASGSPAAPTWLGTCVYGAWNGSPGTVRVACDGQPSRPANVKRLGALTQAVFRVNRNAIVLNDLETGEVYDLDSGQKVDNWQDVKPRPIVEDDDDSSDDEVNQAQDDQPPKAQDDKQGARPGRTTVIHVLDNDSDPQGYVLTVTGITDADPSVPVSIAPDGQTVQVALPDGSTGTQFRYTVDNGHGFNATALVRVVARGPEENGVPHHWDGYKSREWSVVASTTLSAPVIGDWRDPDGDPVVLVGATAPDGTGGVSTTAEGRVVYQPAASAASSTQVLGYQVSDGYAAATPVDESLSVNVLSPTSTALVAPTALPDVLRGVVGRPIVIHPLDNDLPGADPSAPGARLAIAGQVASPEGSVVTTDVKEGAVTLVASRPGTVLLSYAAAYGNAPFSSNQTIRVDVTDPPAIPEAPVAMPDVSVVRGQSPNIVDALANDFDPDGGLLVVQRVDVVGSAGQLQVAVVQGRWLRINALTATLATNPLLVRYTVTNGVTDAVGEVTVTWLPSIESDVPVTESDYATVRSGDSVLVPVLDNDRTQSGEPLALASVVAGRPSGSLPVTSTNGDTEGVGDAFVSGLQVRYVPPSDVTSQQNVVIDYVAKNSSGDVATGHVYVTVVPAPNDPSEDLPPTPTGVDARVVAGDRVDIPIATYGVDPEGDSVTVTAIGSAPALGRIMGIGATSISYEAFPVSAGTDTFTFEVTDAFGKSGRGSVRIAVVPPGDPQPPVAVDDEVTAAPGSVVSVDVLANDIVAAGGVVTVAPASSTDSGFPAGVELGGPTGPLTVTAPNDQEKPLVVLYSVTDGIGVPSVARVTVRSVEDYNNPPRAFDVFAEPDVDAVSVDVDVLSRVLDVEGDSVEVLQVGSDSAPAVHDGRVAVPVSDQPHGVVYKVRDDRGGVSAAVIHVPNVGAGAPYVKRGALVTIDKDGSKTIDIGDYVQDPAGKTVRLTTSDEIGAAPALALQAVGDDEHHLTLTGLAGYNGPAAISFEVTNGASLDEEGAQTVLLTVPVQVGPDTPVLRCPTTPISVIEGGPTVRVDVASVCHVWMSDREKIAGLAFDASWTSAIDGVDIDGSGSHTIALTASGGTPPGSQGEITVGVPGTDAVRSSLNVQVTAAPPPTINPIVVDGFKRTDTASFEITDYVQSVLRDPQVSVVSARGVDSQDASISASGSTVTITPGANSVGTLTFAVIVTDVADQARSDRLATGSITMNVLKEPDAPTNVQPDRTVLSRSVVLSWTTPSNNGAPIQYYTVDGPGVRQQCPASPCSIVNLTNGQDYSFTVTATNAVGEGPQSQPSPSARPDAVPPAVTGLRVSDPLDGRLTLSWSQPAYEGTPINAYRLSWGNGGSLTTTDTTATITGLNNNSKYTFSVVGANDLGPSPASTVAGQSAGQPGRPKAPALTYTDDLSGNRRVERLSWAPVDPNGIAPARYEVRRSSSGGGKAVILCASATTPSCVDPNINLDGTSYTYTVVAMNAAASGPDDANHTSPEGEATTIVAAATPDGITNPRQTVTPEMPDGVVGIRIDLGASHGATSSVQCTYQNGSCGDFPGLPTGGQKNLDLSLTFSGRFAGQAQLVACNGTKGGEQSGADCSPATAITVSPNWSPTQVSVSCASNRTNPLVWTWTGGDVAGARTVTYTVSGVSGGSQSAGRYELGVPQDGGTRTLTVTARDNLGNATSDSAQCTAPDPPPPPAQITASLGGQGYLAGACTVSSCHWLRFSLSAGFPTGTYSWQCITDGAVSYDSAAYGKSYRFVAGQTYEQTSGSGFCIWGSPYVREQIRINGVTSNAATR